MCDFPISAFWTGRYTDKGRKDYFLDFSRSDRVDVVRVSQSGKDVSPSADMVNENGHSFLVNPVRVPCGHCPACRMAESRKWVARMVLEQQCHDVPALFLTLTFDNWCTIDGDFKDILQRFLKRLRKVSGQSFRYFACFELGEVTKRPHYHLILFGYVPKFSDDVLGRNRFHDDYVSESWKYGLHEVSVVYDSASLAYVAGYVQKKSTDEYAAHSWRVMSRRPGLGLGQFARVKDSVSLGDFHVYGDFGSRTYDHVPRYFLDKMEDLNASIESHKEKQREKAEVLSVGDLAFFGITDKEVIGKIKSDSKRLRLRCQKGF